MDREGSGGARLMVGEDRMIHDAPERDSHGNLVHSNRFISMGWHIGALQGVNYI